MISRHHRPETVEWRDVRYSILLKAADTGGAVSIVDSVSRPDTGPPRHVHGDCDETFVVLSGDVAFEVAGRLGFRGPGQAAFVPRGAEHSFRVIGPAPARMLTIFSPGGFEDFFVRMARGHFDIPADMARITAIGRAFNLRFTGPPLGPDEIHQLTGDTR